MAKLPQISLICIACFLAACSGANATPVAQPADQLSIAQPSPGASYSGPLEMGDRAKQATIAFQISPDGAVITSLQFLFKELQCAGFSAGEFSKMEQTYHPITGGKFKFASDSFGSLSGEFTSPEKATGSIELKLATGFGQSVECGSASFMVQRVPGEAAPAPVEPAVEPSAEPASPKDTPLPLAIVTSPPTGSPKGPSLPSYAGKTFSGPLDGGSITFTVSPDGLAIESEMIVEMKNVGCTEGGPVEGGYSVVDQKITSGQPVPIQDNQIHYGSLELNPFDPTSGMELTGQFDSDTSASGTFGMDVGDAMNHCTLGPFEWTATIDTSTVPATTPPTSQPPLLTPLDLPGGDIAVVNVFSTEYGDDLYILGEVENRTAGYIGNINLTATIYDANGNQTATLDEHAQHDELAPGERGPFVIDIPKPADFTSFSLIVHSDPRGSAPPAELRIVDQVIEGDSAGMLQVSGLVENGTPNHLQYVMVVVVFYDAEGRVIGVGGNFPAGPDEILIPGKHAPFQFNPKPFNMGEYTDFRLIMTNNGYPVDSAPSEFEISTVQAGAGVLQGEVTFPGPGQAGLPILWATTFDEQGKLIEVAWNYIEADTLGAGETGAFSIELDQADYTTYELFSEYFIE